MRLKIQHIIDLECLLDRDDERSLEKAPEYFQERDREIFRRINTPSLGRRALLLEWLKVRKQQVSENSGSPEVFPGELFERIYSMGLWLTGAAGLFAGIFVATAFLVYHGTRPVNVTLFVFVFVFLPFVLTLLAAGLAWLKKRPGKRDGPPLGLIHTLIFSVMLKTFGKLLGRLELEPVKKGRETIESIRFLVKKKAAALNGILFWPFFMLTCVFSACFSLGTLGATFFRVVISDLAFGWQSTLSASGSTVYKIVSVMSWPWKYLVPETMTHPGIDQIEGSRIILKEGIAVLATQDLVSWWPFLCMAIIFYAILPRLILMGGGAIAGRYRLANFNFAGPQVNELIARMTTPVVAFDVVEEPVSQTVEPVAKPEVRISDAKEESLQKIQMHSLMLINSQIYPDNVRANIMGEIKSSLLFNIENTISITHDFKTDEEILKKEMQSGFDQVILVQESWQPPIRGLLFYISQVASTLPGETPFYIVLTGDAGNPDPFIEQDDPDFEIWQKAVRQLDNPMIKTRGLFAK